MFHPRSICIKCLVGSSSLFKKALKIQLTRLYLIKTKDNYVRLLADTISATLLCFFNQAILTNARLMSLQNQY